MSSLGCADEEAAGDWSDRELSPTPSTDTQTGHPKDTRSERGSVAAPHKLLATCK